MRGIGPTGLEASDGQSIEWKARCGSGNDSGGCQLEVNNGPGTASATNDTVTIPDSSTVELPAEGVAHLPGSSNIIYSCYATLSGTTASTAITAIKVETASP